MQHRRDIMNFWRIRLLPIVVALGLLCTTAVWAQGVQMKPGVAQGMQTKPGMAQQQQVVITPAAPGAPTIGTAKAGNAQVSVAFTAPSNIGSAAITDYLMSCNTGQGVTAGVAKGSASPLTVSGLVNGTAYTCKVGARNAVGFGPVSAASNSVTPTAPVAAVVAKVSTDIQLSARAAGVTSAVDGTSSFTSDCGSDGVMAGIRVRTGTLVDSVQAICVKVGSNGAWAGGQFDGTRAGGNGGSPSDLLCDQGSAVTAVFGNSGSLIDRVGVRCGKLGVGGGMVKAAGASAPKGPAGGAGGSAFDQPCMGVQIARGISGTAGTLVATISVNCYNPTAPQLADRPLAQTASALARPLATGPSLTQTVTTPQAFQPKNVTTGELTMTGMRFQPKNVTTGELTMTGMRFQPKNVTTGELTMIGGWKPKNVTTGELTMTGLRFQPKNVTTGELTMTGLRE